MRILKGMMVCMAALFMFGYVNSCDTGTQDSLSKLEDSNPQETVR
jgi:hypothetical protein